MVEINKKKYIISLFVTVFGLISLISGTSYAILRGDTESTNEQVIHAGSVELSLAESFNSIDTGVSVMKDTEGLQQETVYEFTVKNIGSVPAKYDLKLLNTSPSGQTALDDSYIRIGLEVNGQEMGPMGLSNVSNVIDSNTIYENEIIKYKMRVWLDKTKATQIQTNSTKKAYLSLKVDAKQANYVPRVVYRWSDTIINKGDSLSLVTGNTTNYTTLNKSYFLKHIINSNDIVDRSEVCYIFSNSLYCLKGYDGDGVENSPYYDINIEELKDSFGTSNCTNQTNSYSCASNGITAIANLNGLVRVSDTSNNCYVDAFGRSACLTN